mmetsp:Transcript_4152/g.9871  ORF Transcript_4152/g.9871 Transcript_4152/m.9871 type:complete len:82 (+) Transcript_4152:286-531(+)
MPWTKCETSIMILIVLLVGGGDAPNNDASAKETSSRVFFLGHQKEDFVAKSQLSSTITVMVSCWKSCLSCWLRHYRRRSIR